MKSKDLYNSLVRDFLTIYPDLEAQSMAFILLEELYGITQMNLITNKEIATQVKTQDKLRNTIKRLLLYEPVQYVIGNAHFYGRNFKVNPNVLIPRKETEELVDLIISNHPNFKGNILDIGTGSGCIAITLSLAWLYSKVQAVDISKEALATAIDNAKNLEAAVDFYEGDIFSSEPFRGTYDIIVSNPPYVMNKEKKHIKKNVLDYEPSLALFVENDDPLIFYHTIIKKASKFLNATGKLYFEINEQFGTEVLEMLELAGFKNVELLKDMQGKDRMVKGVIST